MEQLLERETDDRDITIKRLANLYSTVKNNGDSIQAGKLRELYKKVQANKFSISFCGHFSAGKSSLLNRLIEESILPSSPIPTSGNLVKLKHGTPEVKVFTTDDQVVVFPAPFDIDEIQAFCKDAENVASIDIHVGDRLPESIELIDTPGVDSTDDAHQKSTENALHLADFVVYVTDYNHVQSTINFQFMERLAKLDKPFYLVINQIDKHQEQELPFDDFKKQVKNALDTWQLYPERIFYVSLLDRLHPFNEFKRLERSLNDLLQGDKQPALANLHQTLGHLIKDHQAWLSDRLQDKLTAINALDIPNRETLDSLENEKNNFEQQLADFSVRERNWLSETTSNVQKTIDSAILMPYETREHAKNYLQSCQNDFKTGLFTSKKKVLIEQHNRLDTFYHDIVHNVQTMEWNVRDTIVKACQGVPNFSEPDLSDVYGLSLDIKPEDLSELVQNGAQTTGQYVLKFADTVSESLKKRMKKQAKAVIDMMSTKIQVIYQAKRQETENNYLDATSRLQHSQTVFDLNRFYQEKKAEVQLLMEAELWDIQQSNETLAIIAKDIEESSHAQQVVSADKVRFLTEKSEQTHQKDRRKKQAGHMEDVQAEVTNHSHEKPTSKRQSWSRYLSDAADIIENLHGFSPHAKQLRRRSERIENNAFTIALFGAFSAGKTSFANALLGEQVLPVSPNPTTAVINKIMPTSFEHPHRSVEVKIKSEKNLLEDINHSLSYFNKKIEKLTHLIPVINKIDKKALRPQEKLHYTFLLAVVNGITHFSEKLGKTLLLDLSEANDVIANEEKSCFIEEVAIYYDCSFTRQGIVLVDTPGADSINARHTGVSFDYIKNADAILFVTYYNHAFSRADKEFLIQLGRVKESFAMDKMFFIVNAIDLAKSENEKNEVIDYVENNLLSFGIRHPRLYGISSQMALLSEQTKDRDMYKASGALSFMRDWTDFSVHDLLYHTVKIGFTEIRKTIKELEQVIKNTQLSEGEKAERKEQLKKIQIRVKETVGSVDSDTKTRALTQHIDELFHYVKKRIVQRYLDEFTTFFNPALFQDKSDPVQPILENSLNDYLEFLSFDIDQEMRATFLRIEVLIKKQLHHHTEELNQLILATYSEWSIKESDDFNFENPKIKDHLDTIGSSSLTSVFKHFKSPKHFFEKQGKELMKEELKEKLDEPLDLVLEKDKAITQNHYVILFNQRFKGISNELIEDITHNVGYQLDVLNAEDSNISDLLEADEKLTMLMEKIKMEG